MKKTKFGIQKSVVLLLVFSLLFSLAACAAEKKADGTETCSSMKEETFASLWDSATYDEDQTFGNGSKKIEVEVVAEEKRVTFTIKTDKENLADALLEFDLAEGEEGPYGLYIKKVNGILADYEVDATYWSLTQNGEVLMAGASDIAISGGEHFELTRTK